MSGKTTPPAADARADAASHLMDRQLSEDWSEGDEAGLENWLDESLAHRVAYWRLEAAWEQTDRLAALRRPMREAPVAPARNWPFFARIAAAVVVVGALGAGAVFYAGEPSAKAYATEIGGRETITLRDGSQIELNTDSSVRVALSEGERKVWLDKGEAFFQVRHNDRRPFVVIASGHRIVDVGTKFSVRREAAGLSVAVTEGRVKLETGDAQGRQSVTMLKAGDVALAGAKTVSVARKPVDELSTELKWRTGLIEFRYVTLADAAREFNRYNRTKLVVADPAAARLSVVGTFGTNDVDAFVRLAQKVFGLHVVQHEDETVITR